MDPGIAVEPHVADPTPDRRGQPADGDHVLDLGFEIAAAADPVSLTIQVFAVGNVTTAPVAERARTMPLALLKPVTWSPQTKLATAVLLGYLVLSVLLLTVKMPISRLAACAHLFGCVRADHEGNRHCCGAVDVEVERDSDVRAWMAASSR